MSPNRRARALRRAMTLTSGSAPPAIAATARPPREPAAKPGLPTCALLDCHDWQVLFVWGTEVPE